MSTKSNTAYRAATMAKDLAHRSLDIHWPEAFHPETTALFAHNEIIIDASVEKIWKLLVDLRQWPVWYPNVTELQVLSGGPILQQGTHWQWKTFDTLFESDAYESEPYSRLGWYGYLPGTEPAFCHTWYLAARGESCLVITEESAKGPEAEKIRKQDEAMMHRGHRLWLEALKWMAEK